MDNAKIGKLIYNLRKNAKLTQIELAEKFNYSDKSISKWENGESLPSIDVLYQLASFYNTTLDGLTSTEENIPTKNNKDKRELAIASFFSSTKVQFEAFLF